MKNKAMLDSSTCTVHLLLCRLAWVITGLSERDTKKGRGREWEREREKSDRKKSRESATEVIGIWNFNLNLPSIIFGKHTLIGYVNYFFFNLAKVTCTGHTIVTTKPAFKITSSADSL